MLVGAKIQALLFARYQFDPHGVGCLRTHKFFANNSGKILPAFSKYKVFAGRSSEGKTAVCPGLGRKLSGPETLLLRLDG